MKTKKEILEIIRLLKEEYPLAECSLDYDHAWQLLVSVWLAAQCTDARVNIVTEELFAKYPSVAALAAAEPEEIEEIVRPCGLGHSKARDISLAMRMLMRDFGGKVPDDFDTLLTLPGVGRKSANLIMGDVFGKPAIVTDTHCIRLCNRMGIVKDLKEPKRSRWHFGRSSHQRRAMISVIVLCCMAARSATPAHPDARRAASRNCAAAIAMHSARRQGRKKRVKAKGLQ